MPIIAHNDLPTYKRLMDEGRNILPHGRAITQDIRELHIGFLNMMPDASLQATERQFLRLIGESNQISQFYVHLFSLPEIDRSEDTKAYIKAYYEPFEKLQGEGLDALVITGANVADPRLENNAFWEPLQSIMQWSWENVTSTITACLATHAVMQFRYGYKRSPLPHKQVGVYQSRITDRMHPLVQSMNTVFDVPHSRHNQITQEQFEQANMKILVNGNEGGVHMATSPDGLRLVCFQGHQEYDTVSILKEFRRDLNLYYQDQLEEKPNIPYNYFGEKALKIVEEYLDYAEKSPNPDPFPEEKIAPLVENTWRDSAKAVIGNWIGKVYQVTNMDRRLPFMEGIDPDNPLNL